MHVCGKSILGVWAMIVAVLLLATSLLVGCEPVVHVVHPSFADLRKIADPEPHHATREEEKNGKWVIPLERFAGPDRMTKAEALAQRLRKEAGLSELRIEDNAGVATLAAGPIDDPESRNAQAMLEQVRKARIDGIEPYQNVSFASSVPGGRKVYDPLNLRAHPGMYTLQIGFYDDRFQGDRRAAAEKAVHVLRKQGTQAYYYHGPFRSMVTVGLFTHDEAFVMKKSRLSPGAMVQAYSPEIHKLEKKFPYNLGDGVTLIETKDGKKLGAQHSSLVRVPDY